MASADAESSYIAVKLLAAALKEAGTDDARAVRGAVANQRLPAPQGEVRIARGPFDLTGDLSAGFWMIKANSLDDVIEHMKRAPFPSGQIEIRQVYAAEDFGVTFTQDLRERQERLRTQVAKG